MGSDTINKYIAPCIMLFFIVYRLPLLSLRLSFQLLALYATISLFAVLLVKKGYVVQALFLLLSGFQSYYPILTASSMQSIRTLLIGMLCYFVVSESKLNKDAVVNVFCIACLFHIAFIVLQAAGLNPYWIYGLATTSESNVGLTANVNEGSAMIALLAPCFFRKLWVFCLPLLFFGLFLSKATGGALAVLVITFCYFFFYKKYRYPSILAVTLLAIVFYTYIDKPDIGNRPVVWADAVKTTLSDNPVIVKNVVLEKNIILGFGIGHWHDISLYALKKPGGAYFERAHNTFIHCFLELGVLFVILLVLYAAQLIKYARKNMIFVFALTSIFIVCSVNSAFRINALNSFIMIIWLALIESERRQNNVDDMPKLRGYRKGTVFS
jgi:hypothetical protein